MIGFPHCDGLHVTMSPSTVMIGQD